MPFDKRRLPAACPASHADFNNLRTYSGCSDSSVMYQTGASVPSAILICVMLSSDRCLFLLIVWIKRIRPFQFEKATPTLKLT